MDWLKKRINDLPKLKKTLISLYGLRYKTKMFLLNKTFGIDNKKAVFISFGGKQYSDNPRAISEKLHEMCPDFKIVWIFINPEEKKNIVPSYVKCIKAKTFQVIKELATSKFWIDNATKHTSTYKSKEQIYIQTWHGDRGFKKILHDSHKVSPNAYYIEQDRCNLMLSGSEYRNRVIKSAFKYNGKIMEFGIPRNDLLLNYSNEDVIAIQKTLSLPINKKILLYAPTLRRFSQGKEQEIRDIDLNSTIIALENKTGYQWLCLIRAHSSVKRFANSSFNSDKIIDVTSYEDMRELLLISDLLITDYSSSAGDFALLKRPIILFQADRDKYLQDDRTFYFDIDASPFTVVFSQEELIAAIQELDIEKAAEQCEQILSFYGAFETGQAAQRVVEYMVENR